MQRDEAGEAVDDEKTEQTMIFLGMHTGHDAGVALFAEGELVAYCKEERLTRKKSDGRRLLLDSVEEVFRIAGVDRSLVDAVCLTRMNLPLRYYKKTARPMRDKFRRIRGATRSLAGEMHYLKERDESKLVREDRILEDLGLRPDAKVTFCNHHYAHILGAFRYTTWDKDALYISADGGGDGITYSAYYYDGTTLKLVYGGDDFLFERHEKTSASVGLAYQSVTKHLGFRPNRHEGKITGLAAYGKPVIGADLISTFILKEDGSFDSRFEDLAELEQFMFETKGGLSKEDLAASIQYTAETVVVNWIHKLRKLYPGTRRIGMSGGVFSNVRLNQKVAELSGIEEVFVFPPMGDEGLPVGNCIHMEIETSGLAGLKRSPLPSVYLGRPYSGKDLFDEAQKQEGFTLHATESAADAAAVLLAENHIGAIYAPFGMEMGPRALGARSIIASPTDRRLNDTLNERLERTEFMPFAPYVLDEDAKRVFKVGSNNWEACRYMTITTDVEPEHQDQIPAVVHVDGTARPQIIERTRNPLYYDIMRAFRDLSGIPCLVNTSFNAHEEPIINIPAEALAALRDGRIDFLVCDQGLIVADEKYLKSLSI
ncbi:MAG: hypothetical protein HQL53_07565 [Magnetococcales bacterium]|nr:hypothetical protein [Magnetococcales bacterium]